MTLRNLQVFLAIAECGNMTKAAEKLYISQPSVSLAISEIEKTYNVTLFERLPGRLRLTPTGERLRKYAQEMLSIEKDMEQFLAQESTDYCVRIGATITIGSSVMSSIISEARIQLPKINYHVEIDSTRAIEQKILDGDLDIALVEGEIKNPSLETRPFIDDRLVLICSPEHPLSSKDHVYMKDLEGIPLILREQGSGTRTQFNRAVTKSGITTLVRFSSVSYGAIIDAVEHNLGAGVISEHLAKRYSKTGSIHMCRFADADLSRTFKLVYRKDRYITDILEELLNILLQNKRLQDSIALDS